jgi:hypothetical protein
MWGAVLIAALRGVVPAAAALAAGATLAAAPTAAAAPEWQFHPLVFPDDPTTLMELGPPGDLQFRPGSNNRALLTIGGASSFPRPGIFTFDGVDWKPLAEVCDTEASNARVAWAGPAEFWAIAQPSPPRGGVGGADYPDGGHGLGLCHFRDGEVVGSYSRAPGDPDRFFELEAAACRGPSDCWFGGIGADDPTGTRFGAFHVRWNGADVTTVYAPQGRGVTDIAAFGNGFFESVRKLRRAGSNEPPDLAEEEPVPVLIHTLESGVFRNLDWFPATFEQDTELYGLDVDGTEAWAVGGGAPRQGSGVAPRGPIAARFSGGEWREVPLPAGVFGPQDRFTDVAAVPGSDDAWVAVQPAQGNLSRMRPQVARIAPDGAVLERFSPVQQRGAAAKIDCVSPDDCWMVTQRGILFHYFDPAGPKPPRDTDPAFAEVIVHRPNEAAAQTIPSDNPEDDSQLFAPPPIELPPEPPLAPPRPGPCQPRAALIKVLKSSVRGSRPLKLRVAFALRRKARVRLVGYRGKRAVARSKLRTMKRGRHAVALRVTRKRFPTRLRFRTKELTKPGCRRGGSSPGGNDTVVTTGPGAGETVVTTRFGGW